MNVNLSKCIGCGTCAQICPLNAIKLKKKKAFVDDQCTHCGACARSCPEEALSIGDISILDAVQCKACPIGCRIKEGNLGACLRYSNKSGKIGRVTPIIAYNEVDDVVGPDPTEAIRRPLITGIGAGTTYPDCIPAPYIVNGKKQGVDVVTVVTEAPLSYSAIIVKIDTDIPVGDEGAPVLVGKKKVGLVTTEQYGSKMLSIGGGNLLTGKDGLVVAKTIVDIANKKRVKLKVDGGSIIEIQVGEAPVINGQEPENMKVGCGSAIIGLFSSLLKQSADEAIILDSHVTGLMSEHAAGRFVGAKTSGIKLKFRESTPGRYFGDHGKGWGGTSIIRPLDIIGDIDRKIAQPGMHILITETTGHNAAMFELQDDGSLKEIPLNAAAEKAIETISSSCEPSFVSALYIGGAGGSSRASIVRYPVKLTQAVHQARAHLTVGGAPVFVLPGGGINFMVDVRRVKGSSFYWTPTPATICPIEYTMELKDYEEMGGHIEAMRPFCPPIILD